MCCATIRNGNDDGKYGNVSTIRRKILIDTINPEPPKFDFTCTCQRQLLLFATIFVLLRIFLIKIKE